MYCPGMGQHRKHKEHNFTYFVCMALSRKVCNVIVDKQRVSQIDPRLIQQSEKKFVNVKSSIEGSNSSRGDNNYYNIIMNFFIIN